MVALPADTSSPGMGCAWVSITLTLRLPEHGLDEAVWEVVVGGAAPRADSSRLAPVPTGGRGRPSRANRETAYNAAASMARSATKRMARVSESGRRRNAMGGRGSVGKKRWSSVNQLALEAAGVQDLPTPCFGESWPVCHEFSAWRDTGRPRKGRGDHRLSEIQPSDDGALASSARR